MDQYLEAAEQKRTLTEAADAAYRVVRTMTDQEARSILNYLSGYAPHQVLTAVQDVLGLSVDEAASAR
jgi:hypothetical protein